VAGALAGVGLARMLAGTGAAGVGWTAFEVAAAVGAGALVIMLVPVVSTVTPGTARARRGRQTAIAGITRAGADLALVLLAVGTGTLALSQRQSWTRAVQDQAAFSAGAGVRVQASQPLTVGQAAAVTGTPGVRHAMPVASFEQPATDGVTLAIGAGQAANV